MLIIAHRGASGYEPENTLRSFSRAVSLKADMVEMDIYLCKSGEPVVLHDRTLDRTTSGKGCVSSYNIDELKLLDAGKGEKIPSLEDVLNLLGRDYKVNLELKGENTAFPVAEVIRRYVKEQGWDYKNFYISSFNHPILLEMQKLIPLKTGINISPLIAHLPADYAAFAERFNPYSINITVDFMNTELVNDAHDRGMKVFVYLVNDAADLQKMNEMGVDGIFTDYPDIA